MNIVQARAWPGAGYEHGRWQELGDGNELRWHGMNKSKGQGLSTGLGMVMQVSMHVGVVEPLYTWCYC